MQRILRLEFDSLPTTQFRRCSLDFSEERLALPSILGRTGI